MKNTAHETFEQGFERRLGGVASAFAACIDQPRLEFAQAAESAFDIMLRQAIAQLAFQVTAEECGARLSLRDKVQLERAFEIVAPLFEKPGRRHYRLTVKLNGQRMRLVYDARLRCLVSVLWARPVKGRTRV